MSRGVAIAAVTATVALAACASGARPGSTWYEQDFGAETAVRARCKPRLPIDPLGERATGRAPGGVIEGRVISSGRGTGLEGVEVVATSFVLCGEARTVTDATGAYVLAGLPVGDYRVVFDHGEHGTKQVPSLHVRYEKATSVVVKFDIGESNAFPLAAGQAP